MQITLIIIIVLAMLYIIARRQNRTSVSLQQVQADLQHGAALLDVRTPGEFTSGHATGSKNISLQQLQSGQLPKTAKDKPVYVYCHSGARASAAKRLLQRAGYENVVNIGGLSKWRSMGGAVVK